MRREFRQWDVKCDVCGYEESYYGYEFKLPSGWGEEKERNTAFGCSEIKTTDYCYKCWEKKNSETVKGGWTCKYALTANSSFRKGDIAVVTEDIIISCDVIKDGVCYVTNGTGAAIEKGSKVVYGKDCLLYPAEQGEDGLYRPVYKEAAGSLLAVTERVGNLFMSANDKLAEGISTYTECEKAKGRIFACSLPVAATGVWTDLPQLDNPSPEEEVKTRECGKCGKTCPENELVDVCNAYRRYQACKDCSKA